MRHVRLEVDPVRSHVMMVVIFSFLALVLAPTTLQAAPTCTFVLGFQAFHDRIPAIVGDCLVNEHSNPTNGDSLQ